MVLGGRVSGANPYAYQIYEALSNAANEDGELKVFVEGIRGEISADNSSSSLLLADQAFEGDWVNVLNVAMIYVNVTADVASATDGLCIEYSPDAGTTTVSTDSFTIEAGAQKTFSFQASSSHFRVVYTNGGSDQNTFQLQTVFKSVYGKPSSHRIQDPIVDDDDAELVKAVLTAKANGSGFTNITATESNNLRVTDAESGLAIAKGDVAKTSFIHKFGNAPDFDATDGIVTVWDGADDADIGQMTYVYSTTDDIDSLSSSNAADTMQVEVIGLDANYEEVTQTINLTGQARVALTTNLLRVFRVVNTNSSDNAGHIYCYVNTTLSAGVPVDTTKVRAVMQPGNNQTLMAVYTIPANTTGYMRDWYASTAGANKNANYVVQLRARPENRVFQLKHISALSDNGTSAYQHKYEEPEVFPAKTDLEIRTSVTAAGATVASVSAGFDIVLIEN